MTIKEQLDFMQFLLDNKIIKTGDEYQLIALELLKFTKVDLK